MNWSAKIANYYSIRNLRQLSLNLAQLRLVSQTFSDYKTDDNKKEIIDSKDSLMYEIEDMDSPVDINPMLTLFSGSVKPLCDFWLCFVR